MPLFSPTFVDVPSLPIAKSSLKSMLSDSKNCFIAAKMVCESDSVVETKPR